MAKKKKPCELKSNACKHQHADRCLAKGAPGYNIVTNTKFFRYTLRDNVSYEECMEEEFKDKENGVIVKGLYWPANTEIDVMHNARQWALANESLNKKEKEEEIESGLF